MPASPRPARRPLAPGLAAALVLAAVAGCATRADNVAPQATPVEQFSYWSCERLWDEADRVQQRAADVAYEVDSRVGNNIIALGLGVTVFWPALMAMRPDGLDAIELAQLKGRHEALKQAQAQRACGEAPQAMAPERAARVPVAAGERLVYELKQGAGQGVTHQLGMQVVALRRDHIEMRLDLDGQALAEVWRPDLAGNPLPANGRLDQPPPVLAWRRLLKPGLELGQVLAGDLLSPEAEQRPARVRGQVVARGAQVVAGRKFNVAVIELYGDAPAAAGSEASTRLDGVMAVDADSGLLLRLDLRSANPGFALRQRLARVEAAAPAPVAAASAPAVVPAGLPAQR